MDELTRRLQEQGVIRTTSIIEALTTVDRKDFVGPDFEKDAALNEPLPIGFGQTISQPQTVAFMLELLQPGQGQKILDVGAGSGWTAALLARLVGPTGRVFAIERIPQLRKKCEENLRKINIDLPVLGGDGALGLPQYAPFDRIHIAAAAREIPPALIAQLAVGGRMVIPIGDYVQEIILVEKRTAKEINQERFPGYQFVPLVTDAIRG